METCCNYTGDQMYISSDEKKIINRILRFKESHPEEVKILAMPQDNDGCLYCIVPSDWLKITPPVKHELTEEQKAAAAERLANIRENRKKEE